MFFICPFYFVDSNEVQRVQLQPDAEVKDN